MSKQFKDYKLMQKYEEKPIPLVIRDEHGKYFVNQEALQLFSSIQGKLAIISVAGVYRTGKSYLLNTLVNCKNGFAVGPTVNPKTKGIWVWGKPLTFQNSNHQNISVLVLDSQGLGSTQQDVNHDLRLFSISLLLSSTFMYNTVGAIDQTAIDRLGLVLRLCEHLKTQNFNDFPDFNWILRDFSLALIDKNNRVITTKDYLQNCLSNQVSDSEYRNKIRQAIKQAFEVRNCYTFYRPLTNQQSLQNLDKLDLEKLRPQFVEQIIQFKKSIFGNLRIKTIKGRQVTGPMLCQLINIYVDCINSDKLPVIESGWQQLCLKQLHQVLFDIEEAVSKRVRDMKQRLPRSKKQLIKQQQMLLDQFQQIFDKRLKNNDKAKQYFNAVQQMITKQLKGIQQEMKAKNSAETQAFVRKQFQSIQRKLQQSQFKSMGQLVKEFQSFYEFFRKKCPYKDQVQTGLELLMKKFSDSSLILFKNVQSKRDIQMAQLVRQKQAKEQQSSIKQQKYKQQRSQLQDKIAKLQTNLSDLQKQNDQMSRLIQELEGKLEIAENMNNNSMEEQLSHQNIVLRKKLMDLQDRQKQLICLHSQQINVLKQQILLKSNAAQHSERQKQELNNKIEQLESLYKNCKQLNEQKIHDLILELDALTQKSNGLQKSMKKKLQERQIMIQQLQKTVQLKNEQIIEINNKTSQQTSLLTEMTLQQERRTLQERQKQVAQFKANFNSLKQYSQQKIKQLQSLILQKDTQFKIAKLSLQQEKALLNQKIQFIKKQSEQKIHKNQNLQEEIKNYIHLIDQKDQIIQELSNQIQQCKNYQQMQGEQIQKRITQMASQLQIKNAQIKQLEIELDNLGKDLGKKIDQKSFKIQEMQIILEKNQQQIKEAYKQIDELKRIKEQNSKYTEQAIQSIKIENQRSMQEQSKNAELSLMQLKNFYQMQKQRLEKRILEQRKKYQYNQANVTMEMKNRYTKQIKALTQQNNELNAKLEDLEQEITKTHNQYEVKIMGLEEDLESERKASENKLQLLKRKYQQATEELSKAEKQHQDDRISFVKRIQGLNFEISKKQKQILQVNVKKQSLQATVNKKDTQLENIRKTMHQQIQSSLKRVSQTQAKYQKINQEYANYKMQAQKQNALLNQRNEFLNARLTQMAKEKDSGSLKNLDKIQRNKINQLKQQLDRQKSQNMSLQAKIQNLRKTQKESSNQYKKQVSELQKQNMFQKQKIQIYQAKISELQIKISQKTQMFKKQVDEMRAKYNTQRLKLQGDIDAQREKLNQIQDEKKQTIFKLQMDLALTSDKFAYAELQKDQCKKQLQQTEKRLQGALNQIKKQNQKGLDVSQAKKTSVDKRYSNQLQLMKMSSKVRQEQLQQSTKKLKQQVKILKDKNFELQQRLNRAQKTINQDKNLAEQIEKLKRQREQMIMAHRNQLVKESDQSKRKYNDLEKKNRQLQKQNSTFLFLIQKQKAKANMQKQTLTEKIKQLQDSLAWQKKKGEPKNRTQSSKSKRISMTSSDVLGGWRG